MKLIAHRGNINGPILNKENRPDYIEEALFNGYDAEIDVWFINNKLFLGHDQPDYKIDISWLYLNKEKLWIHCKDLNSLYYMTKHNDLNYFWHQTDNFTLTSKQYIWTYPGQQYTDKSVIMIAGSSINNIQSINQFNCYGVCSDYVQEFK